MQEQGQREEEELEKEKKLFKLIGSRRGKLGVLTRKRNEINALLEAGETKDEVQTELSDFLNHLSQFESLQESVQSLLPDEEKEHDRKDWFEPKMAGIKEFLNGVALWQKADVVEVGEHGACADSVSPHDSVSQASAKVSRASSRGSKASEALSEARVQRAVLVAQSQFADQQLQLEMEELQLKSKKEKHKMQMKLAEAEARITALSESELLPVTPSGTSTEYIVPTTTKKRQTQTQFFEKGGSKQTQKELKAESQSPFSVQNSIPVQSAIKEKKDSSCANNGDSLVDVMKRQNEITELLLNQQALSQLPQRHISVFHGDPLQYKSFVKSFEHIIESKTDDAQQRLYYLEQYTAGEPRNLVRSCFHLAPAEGYKEAKAQLEWHFGNPIKVSSAFLDKALKWPAIKAEDAVALRSYVIFLKSCHNTMQEMNYVSDLEAPSSLKIIVSKLPFKLRDKWRASACNIYDKHRQRPTLKDLIAFIDKQSRIMLDPIFGEVQYKMVEPRQSKVVLKSNRESNFATSALPMYVSEQRNVNLQTNNKAQNQGDLNAFTKPCMFCNKSHSMEVCQIFQMKPNKDKVEFLKTKGMCFGCLQRGHISKNCLHRMSCTVCQQSHPTLLHIYAKEKQTKSQTAMNGPANSDAVLSMATGSDTGAGKPDCVLSVVPVKVRLGNGAKCIQTYAFLDSGSSATFCTEELAKELLAPNKRVNILLKTMNEEKTVTSYQVSGLEVAALDSDVFLKLPDVFTQKSIPVTHNNIPKLADIKQWPYLEEVNITPIDVGIGLLIGANVPRALEPWKVINSVGNGPYAAKTLLGWVINGPLGCREDVDNSCVYVNRISVANLENLLIKQYNQDFMDEHHAEKNELSQEDEQFLKIVSDSAKLKDGHYYLKLPLRNANVNMPNNRHIAQQRAQHLLKRFEKDQVFFSEYKAFMEEVMAKGYAEIIPQTELQPSDSGKVWYLPHHGVYHPRKKKLRVVFDCAAAFGGTSLNKELLQGPDLTNTLLGVLIRFRQGPVAFITDIEGMFHQVRVAKEDVNLLRFLWWPHGDTSKELVEHRMLVHIFGAVSSPSCATYALLKTADDNQELYPEKVTNTIRHNFYVDDCLKGVNSTEHALLLYRQLSELCAKGGFHLNKWISNDRTVIAAIPEQDRAKEVRTLDLDEELPMERALGVQWDVEADRFTFSIAPKSHQTTRRGILSIVCSIYDPLGFLAPITLVAKQILQNLCKLKLTWDEKVPLDIAQTWKNWLSSLCLLDGFGIKRSFTPLGFGQITSAQLHNFCDASEVGYGAVSYLRLTNDKGEVCVSFVFGKAKVAPLKCTTIPRMELAAAVLAVRLDRMLRTELEYKLTDSTFWSDSMTVLQYIANKTKRFKTYVANRISVINSLSEVAQWKHICTKENPADAASRGLSVKSYLLCETWLKGPEFLYTHSQWPKTIENMDVIPDDDPEIKQTAVVYAASAQIVEQSSPTSKLLSYFSNWMDLKKAVAWILKIKDSLKQKCNEKRKNAHADMSNKVTKSKAEKKTLAPLSVDDLEKAEKAILIFLQKQHFSEEILSLNSGKAIHKSSHLRKLDPEMIDGVLRVGGRLSRAALPEEAKHPAILPKGSNISMSILRYVHEKVGHSGRNHMLSTLRRQFWIPHSNALARKIIKECITCRRLHQRPGEQKMADLPSDRVTVDFPPFTMVGMDYFGPMEVKRGRNTVKRYGVIFTCLTCRAVHLEVAHSLDTDSCINAIRRFVCRRGQVKEIRSDNGTNFISANRELKQVLQNLNQDKIQSALRQDGIKWTFNPPHGAHHGGVWERLVQQVKKILCSVMKQQVVDDEALNTILCEVEAMLNDRPITPSSDDPNDLEALTPNHLLLLKGKPILPPGLFDKHVTYGRRRWKQVQYISDLFWKRWAKEYLPTMQHRQKWNRPHRSFSVGDLVLLIDESAPRNSWPLGRITDTTRDSKGFVRKVRVKTQTSELERPITKICLLLEAE